MANSTFPTPSPLNATSLHTPAPSIFNSRVPSTPPIAPQIPTNSAFGNVNSDKWQDVQFTAFTSLLTGAVLMTLFECMRGRRNRMSRSMYRQRHSLRYRKNNNRLKRIDVPAFPRGFLRWWTSLRNISDAELYDQVGMDGYVTIRFIKLCKRLCFFAAFFGGLILIPIYVKGAGAEVSGTTKLSLSNVDPDAHTMWAPVVFAWFFTLYFLYTMRKEFLTFSDLRNDWLAGGDVARDAQTNYTMRVERIPRAFRSPAILNKFFSELFPEQVHSATVCIGLQDLRALTLQRYKVLQALERAIIRKEALQETTLVRETWCGPKVDAVEHFGTRLAELNQKLRPKQAHKLEAAKTVERLKRKELRNMSASLENMALYFVDQLNRGGQEDEDGNTRLSWLERREGETDYHLNPLQSAVLRQQYREADREIRIQSGLGYMDGGPGDGVTSCGSDSPCTPYQRQQQQQAGARGWASREPDQDGDQVEEEKAQRGCQISRTLSPVAEERAEVNTVVRQRQASTGSIFLRTRPSARIIRAPSLSGGGACASNALHRPSSRRSMVSGSKKEERGGSNPEAQRLLEAEALVNEQGEDLIRHNVNLTRQISNLHQTLGVGAVGAGSVAAPRASSIIHPVNDRVGSGDEGPGGSNAIFGSRRSSNSSVASARSGARATRGLSDSSCLSVVVAGGPEDDLDDVADEECVTAVDGAGMRPPSLGRGNGGDLDVEDPRSVEREFDGGRRWASPVTPNGSLASSFFSVSSPRPRLSRVMSAGAATLTGPLSSVGSERTFKGRRGYSNRNGRASMPAPGAGAVTVDTSGSLTDEEWEALKSVACGGSDQDLREARRGETTQKAKSSLVGNDGAEGSAGHRRSRDRRSVGDAPDEEGAPSGRGTEGDAPRYGAAGETPSAREAEGEDSKAVLSDGREASFPAPSTDQAPAGSQRGSSTLDTQAGGSRTRPRAQLHIRRRSYSVPSAEESRMSRSIDDGPGFHHRISTSGEVSMSSVCSAELVRLEADDVSLISAASSPRRSGDGNAASLFTPASDAPAPPSPQRRTRPQGNRQWKSTSSSDGTPRVVRQNGHRYYPPSPAAHEYSQEEEEDEGDDERHEGEGSQVPVLEGHWDLGEGEPRPGRVRERASVGLTPGSVSATAARAAAAAAATASAAATGAGPGTRFRGLVDEDDDGYTGEPSLMRSFPGLSLFSRPWRSKPSASDAAREGHLEYLGRRQPDGLPVRRPLRRRKFLRSSSGRDIHPKRVRSTMPWDDEDGLDDPDLGERSGSATAPNSTGSRARPNMMGPKDEGSGAGRPGPTRGIMNLKRVERQVKETGKYVRETVRGTVSGAAHTIKKGVGESVTEVAEAVKVLTAAGSMSGTGFVTFKCLAARSCAVQTMVTNRPDVFNLSPAPEPRDIVWKNVTNHVLHVRNRRRLVNAGVAVGIIFWSFVVSGIQKLSDVEYLAQVLPFARDMDENDPTTSLVTAYIPVILLLILINTLYFILKAVALHLEGYKTYSEVERAVMTRYFFFHLANVYVTLGAPSLDNAFNLFWRSPYKGVTVLGDTLPKSAVFFMNLIIVKMVTGLLLELCFAGRPLKFWRILFAELFTDPGLRTKAARTIGAYEPSEPWYGRFFADFLLVLLIVLSFQVIAPVVAILGLLYFMFAEVIYKYQLMHVYWPMYESGGIFFHQLFAQMVVGAVAGQITLLGFMLTRTTEVLQVSFLIPLPIVVLYLAGRWRQEAQRAAVSLSLDKAILQDRQDDIRVRSGADPIWESFSPTAYMQPSLLPGDPDAAFGNGEDGPQDSDVDVDGRLELDENGNVVCGNYCKALKKRRSKKRVPNFKDAARHPRIPLVKRLFARKDRDFASERRKVMKRTRSTSTAKLSSDASNRDMGGFNSNDIEDIA